MPADFPTEVTTPLGRLNALTQTATTFASDVVAVLTAALGTSNPFGTAATRNVGAAAGDVPILNNNARIEPSLVPTATADAAGAVILARSIADARPGVVPTAAQLAALTATSGTGLNAANFTLTSVASNTDFTTPGIGVLLLASSGGGGHAPGAGADFIGTGRGSTGGTSYLRYRATRTNNTGAIVVSGGDGGGTSASSFNQGFRIETVDATQTNAPDFAITLLGKGAQGGDPGGFDPNTSTTGGEVVGVPGGNGDLLIAKFQAGRTFRVIIGGAGSFGTAPNASSGQRRVVPRRGYIGSAFVVRLA